MQLVVLDSEVEEYFAFAFPIEDTYISYEHSIASHHHHMVDRNPHTVPHPRRQPPLTHVIILHCRGLNPPPFLCCPLLPTQSPHPPPVALSSARLKRHLHSFALAIRRCNRLTLWLPSCNYISRLLNLDLDLEGYMLQYELILVPFWFVLWGPGECLMSSDMLYIQTCASKLLMVLFMFPSFMLIWIFIWLLSIP
jgi:hypothetical protein